MCMKQKENVIAFFIVIVDERKNIKMMILDQY